MRKIEVSEKLQNAAIVWGNYRKSAAFTNERAFVYFNPPYHRYCKLSAYTENLFNNEERLELAKLVDAENQRGTKIVVNNFDPKNSSTEDDFFDHIYSSHKSKRVDATCTMNCKSES